MQKKLPLIIASIITCFLAIALLALAIKKNNGVFAYPLDDTYIHLAVAKTLAAEATWGINPGEWVSSSSSPLFTILLAIGYWIAPSIYLYLPLILATLGVLITLMVLQRELNNHYSHRHVWEQTAVICLAAFAGNLHLMLILGMEHSLQTALTCSTVFLAADYLTSDSKKPGLPLLLSGVLMVGLRYENLFVLAPILLLILWRKSFWQAFTIGLVCTLPLILFGFLFYSKGGFPVPNSVLIKGNTNIKSLLGGQYAIPTLSGSLTGLLMLALVFLIERLHRKAYDRSFYLLVMFCISVLLHGVFAQFGWYYRYEAYLLTWGVFQLSLLSLEYIRANSLREFSTRAIAIFFLILTSNVWLRSLNATIKTPAIIHNIYGQQVQMGLFLEKYYPNVRLAANDIGAISCYGNAYVLDLWGLASNDVTKARRGGYWNNEFLQKQVKEKNIELVIIYDSWFDKSLSQPWIKVGEWVIPNNIICGDDNVSFYATSAAAAEKLRKNMQDFESKQPKDNSWSYTNP